MGGLFRRGRALSHRIRPECTSLGTVGNREPLRVREASAQGAHKTIEHDQTLKPVASWVEVIEPAQTLPLRKRFIGRA